MNRGWRRLVAIVGLAIISTASFVGAQVPAPAADAIALDKRLIAEARKSSELMANLTYLSDMIGPRLTGSAALKRANAWTAAKMKAYGLANVHLEPWSLPEGWERGPATGRIIEPANGRALTLASMGWRPGTPGKIQAEVIVVTAKKAADLAAYKGKLKGAIVLDGSPKKLLPLAQIDKPGGFASQASELGKGPRPSFEEYMALSKARTHFFRQEGVIAVLMDAGKHHGLLTTTGGWNGPDRPSAVKTVPTLFVAHEHYGLLYRLATRPAPAQTRIELEVANKFIPGPLAVYNTVGEIKGSEKPDEFVVIGAHLDSWDLGQGTLDNGTGTCVVLETARILSQSGTPPKRTIRFVLFTGEEQGLHGSRAYVKMHKDELPRTSACIVHDTGTGKVIGLGWFRPALKPVLEAELRTLEQLGVTKLYTRGMGGSDHVSFDRAGVPGGHCVQEIAGYRFGHHSQADTLDLAQEADLIQGAQVLAVTAMRLANMDELLPRDPSPKPAPKQIQSGDERRTPKPTAPKQKPESTRIRRFGFEHLAKLVQVSDPQIAPDGKSIVIAVSRPNMEKNRFDRKLVLVDVATGNHRVLTGDRLGVGHPRWSPAGDRLAFLAVVDTAKKQRQQIFVMPMNGGDPRRISAAPEGVQQFAWRPDGKMIAFATADEPAKKDKFDDAFEVGNDGYLTTRAPTSTHIWLVPADGGKARRLTSGPWSLPSNLPPSSPSSPLSWSPDGQSIAFVRQLTPHYGDGDKGVVRIVSAADGDIRALSKRAGLEGFPSFSPDGAHLVYWHPRAGDSNNVNEICLAPASGGEGKSLTRNLDRNLVGSLWMPDGKSVLVGGHDGTRVGLWLQPLDGPAQRLSLGNVSPSWYFWIDAQVGKNGAIAFAGSEPHRPTELYYLSSPSASPQRLTDFNKEVAALDLGKVQTITWKSEEFDEDGVLVYPPDFSPKKKYPLVLYIHGGPTAASTEPFAPLPQLMASHGYIVFSPNYRGSDNLGNAYQRAIFNDAGAGPGRDVMAGLEAVKKRGSVDGDRIAVTGWSYGGYMTTWLISHYHVWKTAVAGAAAIDRNDQYNLADYNVRAGSRFGSSPWVGAFDKAYRDQSPITHAPKIKTPTLILATTGDARVPITQSYRLFHALKDNGVTTRFIAWPVPGHFPADPIRRKDVYQRWVEWLDQYLR